MFPLLPFAVGLLTGAVAVKLVRNEKAKKQLDKAQEMLREATVSSLNSIEKSSSRLRDKLQTAPATEHLPATKPEKKVSRPAIKSATKVAAKPANKRQPVAKPKDAAAGSEG